MKDIFVSRPTWIENKYQDGLDNFMKMLTVHNLKPRTLGVTDYPNQAPLDEVIQLLNKCKGAIILGYPQIIINDGHIKGNKITNTVSLGTEWNHIEAGLAYALNLPLLVIHHTEVGRGIFDKGTMSNFIYKKDFRLPNWSMEKDIQGAINNWKRKCT